jgi:alkylated DNA repair protein alkB homolog 1
MAGYVRNSNLGHSFPNQTNPPCHADWTNRCYDKAVPMRRLPVELQVLAQRCAEIAQAAVEVHALKGCSTARISPQSDAAPTTQVERHVPVSAVQKAFNPDAAIVNYYHAGDHLSGHRDDVEPDVEQPIVSVSLGCPGIFLLGGRTLDEEPLALLLRSGDAVVLTADARLCFHGPRQLAQLNALQLQCSNEAQTQAFIHVA